jgi:hypothetical protein
MSRPMDELQQILKNLHLSRMADTLPEELQRAEKEGLAYTELLLRLVRAQWHHRQETALEWRIRQARLPERWALETFPFKDQPGINKRQIMSLAELDFIPTATNIVFIGPTGAATYPPLSLCGRIVEAQLCLGGWLRQPTSVPDRRHCPLHTLERDILRADGPRRVGHRLRRGQQFQRDEPTHRHRAHAERPRGIVHRQELRHRGTVEHRDVIRVAQPHDPRRGPGVPVTVDRSFISRPILRELERVLAGKLKWESGRAKEAVRLPPSRTTTRQSHPRVRHSG